MNELIALFFVIAPTILLFEIIYILLKINLTLKQISNILNVESKQFTNNTNDNDNKEK